MAAGLLTHRHSGFEIRPFKGKVARDECFFFKILKMQSVLFYISAGGIQICWLLFVDTVKNKVVD
jgi:hypothetical protein